MTTKFNPDNHRYFTDNGDVAAGYKLRFKETGSDTLKDTYTTSALSVANSNPVVLDANGQHSAIWLDGSYRVELLTDADVEVWEVDDVGNPGTGEQLSAWVSTDTYDIGDLVEGSDGNFYQSITSSNSGNNPTTSAANWSQVELTKHWNTNETYDEDAIVKYDGLLYKSLQSSNTGNTPGITPLYWVPSVLAPVTKFLEVTAADAGNTVAVTGVGFRARLIHVNAVPSKSGWEASSFGYTELNGETVCVYRRNDGTNAFGGAFTTGTGNKRLVFLTNNGATEEVSVDIAAIIADGCNLDVSAGTDTTGFLAITFYP